MSLVAAWFWGILLVGATVLLSVAGSLLVRRWATVEVLECHKEVAGFIYAVIGVLYAVLLGFTASIIWEGYEKAHNSVEQEANEVADLFRDAQVFPNELRNELESQLRTYARLVLEKSGRQWSRAGRAAKLGKRITSCGPPITASARKTSRRRPGTPCRSRGLMSSATIVACAC